MMTSMMAVGCEPVTMSSREIAELAGKRHDNVRADIQKMGEELSLIFQDKPEHSGGRPVMVYHLAKRECLILVSGYSLELRARIIDRWQELEQVASKPAFIIPQSLPEALRLAAELAEQKQALEQKVALDAPAVEFAKKIASAEKGVQISNFAKTLGLGPIKLFDLLRDMRILMGGNGHRRNMPFQEYMDRGYFAVRESSYEASGERRLSFTPLITGKGQQWLTTKLIEAGVLKGVAA